MNHTETESVAFEAGERVYHEVYGVLQVAGWTNHTYATKSIAALKLTRLDGTTITLPRTQLQSSETRLHQLDQFANARDMEQALQIVARPPAIRLRGKYGSIPGVDEKMTAGVQGIAELVRDLNHEEEHTFATCRDLSRVANRLRELLAFYWQCEVCEAGDKLNQHLRTHGRPQLDFIPLGADGRSWNQRVPQAM